MLIFPQKHNTKSRNDLLFLDFFYFQNRIHSHHRGVCVSTPNDIFSLRLLAVLERGSRNENNKKWRREDESNSGTDDLNIHTCNRSCLTMLQIRATLLRHALINRRRPPKEQLRSEGDSDVYISRFRHNFTNISRGFGPTRRFSDTRRRCDCEFVSTYRFSRLVSQQFNLFSIVSRVFYGRFLY